MTFRPADLFHSGFLVEDLEASIALLRDSGTRRWTPIKEHELPIRVGDGEQRTERFRYAYSAEGPHHVELIQPLAGGYLQATGPMTFHHLGYWVDDLTPPPGSDAPALECLFLAPDGTPKVSYHVDSAGLRLERVPRSQRPVMEERWACALE